MSQKSNRMMGGVWTPARLEDCRFPERLSGRQWVNLFEERGNELLARALQARATQLSVEKLATLARLNESLLL